MRLSAHALFSQHMRADFPMMFGGKGQGFFNLFDRHTIILGDFCWRHVPLLPVPRRTGIGTALAPRR